MRERAITISRPQNYSSTDERLMELAKQALAVAGLPALVGATWTTDASFRETCGAITAGQADGIFAVEMEAAALYAFAAARQKQVLPCTCNQPNGGTQKLTLRKGSPMEPRNLSGSFQPSSACGAECRPIA